MAPAMNAEELSALEHSGGEARPGPAGAVVGAEGRRRSGRGAGVRAGGREAGWEDAWAEGRRVGREEMRRQLLALTDRDRQLLELLGEHGYLTTEDAAVLLFPTPRRAQRRLLRLRPAIIQRSRRGMLEVRNVNGLGLVTRRTRNTPGPWRRLSGVYALRQKGALVLAALEDLDGFETKQLVQRAANAVRYQIHLEHDLGAIAFFTGLVRASRELPEQGGLYSWVGEATMRRRYLERGGRSAPDGWGRYLVGEHEVSFQLEWDCGTEPLRMLATKAAGYEDFYSERPGGEFNHVLWVADWEPRERRLRQALEGIGPDARYVQHWTSNAELLAEQGHLGPLWRSLTGGGRLSLAELPARPSRGHPLEACLGRSGWWRRSVSQEGSEGVK